MRLSGSSLFRKLLATAAACVVLLLGPVHYYFGVRYADYYTHRNYEDALGWYVYALLASAGVLVVVAVIHVLSQRRSMLNR
jgi:hypothetical protein